MSIRRVVGRGAAVVLVWGALAGCTAEPVAVTRMDASDVVDVSASAVAVDARAEVGLPSGTLTLGVAPDLDPASLQTLGLAPASGVTLVGLAWTFEPHPSSEARDVLLDGATLQSLPQPTVSMIDGSDAVPLSIVAEAGASGGLVIGARDPVGIEVEVHGQTQTVDLDTGAVGAGQADGLIELRDATTSMLRACRARDFSSAAVLDHGCRVEAVHRLPYIDGLGWAPDSQTWLVVDARINGDAVMLLGDDPGTVLDGAPQNVQRVAFAVAGSGPRTVNFDFGPQVGVVAVALEE